jgi:hypothetical protein
MTNQRVSDFSVPRTTLEVELLLANGETRPGMIFLIPRTSLHVGSETPLELLNRTEPVFPFRSDDEGHVLLVTKVQTMRVTTDQFEEPGDPERLDALKSMRVEIELSDGSTVTGTVTMDMPEGRSRLLDYLNEVPKPFFPVSDGETTHYVNRNHVVFSRPVE